MVHKKRVTFIFRIASCGIGRFWLFLVCSIRKMLDVNNCIFGHLTYNTVTTLPSERQVVEHAVCEWCQHFAACIRTGGGHFEHML